MRKWVQYGPVVISAGLFITGVGVWTFRGGVRGELLADAAAGLYERRVLAFHESLDPAEAPPPYMPGFATVTSAWDDAGTPVTAAGPAAAGPYPTWAEVAALLSGLRDAAVVVSTGAVSRVMWSTVPAAAWADGAHVELGAGAVASVPRSYEEVMLPPVYQTPITPRATHATWVYRAYQDGTPTDRVWTASSRSGAEPYQPGVHATNTPFLRAVAVRMPVETEPDPWQPPRMLPRPGRPGWWVEKGLGRTGYVWGGVETASTSSYGHAFTSRWISSNVFVRAGAALTGLVTTVWVGGLSDCGTSQSLMKKWYANVAWSESSLTYDVSVDRAALAAAACPQFSYEAVTGAYTDVHGEILSVDASMEASTLATVTIGSETTVESDKSYSADSYARAWSLHGVRAPHPSAYAYAGGYVARVRVFGVFSTTAEQPTVTLGCPWWFIMDPDDWSADSASLKESSLQTPGWMFGVPGPGAAFPEPADVAVAVSADGDRLPQYTQPSEYRLALLASADSPSQAPFFDIVPHPPIVYRASYVPGATNAWTEAEWEYQYQRLPPSPAIGLILHSRRMRAVLRQTLRCHAVVVVADWRFRHGPGGTPPAPYTPPWARGAVTNLPPLW